MKPLLALTLFALGCGSAVDEERRLVTSRCDAVELGTPMSEILDVSLYAGPACGSTCAGPNGPKLFVPLDAGVTKVYLVGPAYAATDQSGVTKLGACCVLAIDGVVNDKAVCTRSYGD